MSKIYEALLRAELDRLSAGVEGKQTAAVEASPKETFSRYSADLSVNGDILEDELILGLFAGKASDFGTVNKSHWKPDRSRLAALEKRGNLVEQFRSLRSRLYELRSQQPLKSVLVSSALPQEGKSFVAANLAVCLATHQSTRVLLIDGDMRRYTLNNLLGCASEPGLSSYLAGEARLLDVVQQVIPEDDPTLRAMESLSFISGGRVNENAGDLSGNKMFGELIAAMSPHFDWIIIDSSPVNLVSDAANLARSCDGVLLVAREGVTQASEAQKAVGEFRSSNLLGFALNGSEKKKQEYYGYDGLYDRQEQ